MPVFLPLDNAQCWCTANNKRGFKNATHNIRIARHYFEHNLTQSISHLMHVSVHKQPILITNCFGV